MKIALITDAWHPQTNGVVRTLSTTCRELERIGHEIFVIHPGLFRTVACPSYPEIRLALLPGFKINGLLQNFAPDAIHIATEGPLGHVVRRWCTVRKIPFTTAYHTQFPEYLRARAPIPVEFSYSYLRRFHGAASRTMVATGSMRSRLQEKRFRNVVLWSRGVDTDLFKPSAKNLLDLPRPIFVYFGRVAVEKNIEEFLALDLPGSKVVIGDGPALVSLRAKYSTAHFLGYKFGEDLARHIAAADVFVFPSRTDTFGLVLLEAMACGVPVAAYPVTGPVDIVDPNVTGVLDVDLRKAALGALELSAEHCRSAALRFSWEAASRQFLAHLEPIGHFATQESAVRKTTPTQSSTSKPIQFTAS